MASGTVKQDGVLVKKVTTSHFINETIGTTFGRIARTMAGISIPTGKKLMILSITAPISAGGIGAFTIMPPTVYDNAPSEIYGAFITSTGSDFYIARAYFNSSSPYLHISGSSGSSDLTNAIQTIESGNCTISYIII